MQEAEVDSRIYNTLLFYWNIYYSIIRIVKEYSQRLGKIIFISWIIIQVRWSKSDQAA